MIIKIERLHCHTIIGIHDWEKEKSRDLFINLEMEFDGDKAISSDAIKDTIDYDEVTEMLQVEVAKSRFGLLEKLAAHLLKLLMRDTRIGRARIEIIKPNALKNAQSVSVILERTR